MFGRLFKNINKYLLNPLTYVAIIIGILSLIISFLIKNYDMIGQYLHPNLNSIELQGLDIAAKLRATEEFKRELFVDIFNINTSFMSANWLYLYVINIMCIAPVLLYFKARETGYIKSIFLRVQHKKYVWKECIYVVLTGGLITFIPYFFFWCIRMIILPGNLGQDMGMVSTYFREINSFNPFSCLYSSVDLLKWYWLVYGLIVCIYGMCITFMCFLIANIVRKKVILYVAPLAYYYLNTMIMAFLGKDDYSIFGMISYYSLPNSTMVNIMFPIVMILVICMFIYQFSVRKEKIING